MAPPAGETSPPGPPPPGPELGGRMKTLIEASHLSLHYGRKAALQDLTFSIPAGRVVGLLGHNGAGKTTLMKTLVGLKQPTGQLRVLGLDPHATAPGC
ncbi:ATP-binding cassette domain-containing protein [Mitsuaria sp. TWR114]|nr:ATP-binding cassette domain-containing protein [Mitsuaria sp. TWR114]